jgi:hypothetical protein
MWYILKFYFYFKAFTNKTCLVRLQITTRLRRTVSLATTTTTTTTTTNRRYFNFNRYRLARSRPAQRAPRTRARRSLHRLNSQIEPARTNTTATQTTLCHPRPHRSNRYFNRPHHNPKTSNTHLTCSQARRRASWPSRRPY